MVEFDALICAVGREARLEGYGLENLGIETKSTIVTNDYLETLYPNILPQAMWLGLINLLT